MRFDEGQMDWLADLLADAAREEIMPRFRRLDAGDIKQKTSAADLVTEADVNAERYITARLKERFAVDGIDCECKFRVVETIQ
ncbi:MAG: hypothetical protein EAS49_07760, partial [Brucella intermedia]